MTCDYRLIRDLLVTTSDLETRRIYYFDVIDQYYCSDDSDFLFYENKTLEEPEISVIFERTGTIKKWYLDEPDKIKEIIEQVKYEITFDQVIKIEGLDRVEENL